ncbi:MAG TPA: 4Fe-4S dicluster domain-containing protein, partial [Fimbriimonadaceae bacterium]|nr:4Fe-4S dicluster domain-containing protein [Fimbriimonadaceae bacterium]
LARWVQYDAATRRNHANGAVLAFGEPRDTVYKFLEAKVLVSVDSDVMMEAPGSVSYQKDIMAGRDLGGGATEMNRVYAVESAPTTIGAIADHRVPLRASEMMNFVSALANKIGVPGAATSIVPEGFDPSILDAIAKELMANRGTSAVFGGDHLSGDVHALIHAINAHLGNFGKTMVTIDPVIPDAGSQTADLASLAADMAAGQVTMLFIAGGNPVYDAPADLDFANALAQVPFKAQCSSHDDETGAQCDWQLPASHFLEAWGDGRAFDGTASIQQPTILPLYDCKSEHEFVDALIGNAREGMQIVQDYWRSVWGEDGFDERWHAVLSSGVIDGTAFAPKDAVVKDGLVGALPLGERADGLEVVFKPDPTIYDGRFANNGWLQELPKPLSNLTWDNAAYMSHETAKKIGVKPSKYLGFIPADGAADMVTVTIDGRTVELPVYVQHGMADGVVVVHMGYGRTRGGKVLLELEEGKAYEGGGFSAYKLIRAAGTNPYMVVNGANVQHTDNHYPLANSQFHNTIDTTQIDSDREILHEYTLAAFIDLKDPEDKKPPSLYDDDMIGSNPVLGTVFPQSATDENGWNTDKNYQWAMTIDLSLCTGCNACVIACQSENNIPTVGKYQVQRGREMHWIRIDRYYQGTGAESDWPVQNPKIRLQPVACMQCENAPCEPVCPVAATTHSKEGINQMVYNRCVGTRYCSNNCPYKVRRFNFLNYANHNDVPVKMLLNNPDVTVRGRGVMEKCTYCIQRINRARITAKKRGKRIQDGEVRTACQDACPSEAIVFGDMTDATSKVARMLRDRRRYKLLNEEVNTRPRTTYLARVTNENPEVGA